MRKFILGIILINSILIGYTIYNKRASTLNQKSVGNTFDRVSVDKLLYTDPLQEDLDKNDLQAFKKDKFLITPVKKYKIAARVLRKENYRFGQNHEILPVDLVLGWNIMSDMKTIQDNKIKISQSNRFYFWNIDSFEKISRKEIEINSANVHISPLNEEIETQIKDLKKGDLVYLEGYLINIVDTSNNYKLASSLSRKDTGAGACEVILVTNVRKYE